MCGLFGFATKRSVSLTDYQMNMRINLVTALGVEMQSRGTDSSGIGYISNNQTFTLKITKPFTELAKDKQYQKAVVNTPFVIGHTRMRTHGAISLENAHPLIRSFVVGAHNGIISNFAEITPEEELDSVAILELLNRKNRVDAFKEVRGSMAVVWRDTREPSNLFIAVHNQSFAMIEIKELETIFWASTKYQLEKVVQKHFPRRMAHTIPNDNLLTINEENQIRIEKIKTKPYESTYISPGLRSNKSIEVFSQETGGQELRRGEDDFDKLLLIAAVNDGCNSCNNLIVDDFWFDEKMQCAICDECVRAARWEDRFEPWSYIDYEDLLVEMNIKYPKGEICTLSEKLATL